MAEQESWIERRRRMVRCKTHGLHYDPTLSSGCILCVKEWAKLVPQRAPQFTIVLLCVLGMAVILYRVFGPGQSVGAAVLTEEEVVADIRLNPERYRPSIETLEAGLFATVEDGRDLADAGISFTTAAEVLSASIQRLDPQDGGTAAALAALGASTREGFDFVALERLRDNWLRLRQRRFRSAAWFLTPEIQGSTRERVMLAEHRELARGLRTLLYEGAAEVQAIAESEDASGGDELWRRFAADWRQRLDVLWQGKPPRPSASAAVELLIAIQELERAYQRTQALASDPGLVEVGDPGVRFDDVVALIDRAESSLDAVRL